MTGSAYQDLETGGTSSQAMIFGLVIVFLIVEFAVLRRQEGVRANVRRLAR